MKITYYESIGYKRFRLANITSFKYKPEQKIQLILGPNGCGKSSLIEDLVFLPAKHSDYEKDGKKVIEVEHRGNHYRLVSTFSPSQRHVITKNDEELFSGSSPTVAREIIKQELGITVEIHELLIGVERFTDMSTGRRREWFTKLCEANYDYALKIYNKARETNRDSISALKRYKERLAVETSKIMSDDDRQLLEANRSIYEDSISVLMKNLHRVDHDANYYIEDNDSLLKEIESLASRFKKLSFNIPPNTEGMSLSEYMEELSGIKSKIISMNAVNAEWVSRYSKLETVKNDLDKANIELSADKQKDIASLQSERIAILDDRQYGLSFSDPEESLSELESIWQYFNDTVAHLDPDTDRYYTEDNLNVTQEKISRLSLDIRQLDNKIAALSVDIKHMEHRRDGDHTQCPRCLHSWANGFDEKKYNHELNRLKLLKKDLTDKEEESDLLNKKLVDIRERLHTYGQIRDIMSSKPSLRSLWGHIGQHKYITTNPSKIPKLIADVADDIKKDIKAKLLEEKIKRASSLFDQLLAQKINSMDDLVKSMEEAEGKIEQCTKEIRSLSLERDKYQAIVDTMNTVTSIKNRLEDIRVEMADNNLNATKSLHYESISEAIAHNQLLLSRTNKALNEANTQLSIVASINEEIIVLEKSVAASNLLIDTLSPINGLIAEGMTGFINKFVKELNMLISSIWTYPLQVVPCGLSEENDNELDYKFPILVSSSDNIVADINKGSRGIKEIINLVFTLVAMRYLGLSDHYIMLDEPGSSFDADHKSATVGLIKAIMEERNHSQLYLISHDYQQYGSMGNADFVVISEMNVVLPPTYNKVVSIV